MVYIKERKIHLTPGMKFVRKEKRKHVKHNNFN